MNTNLLLCLQTFRLTAFTFVLLWSPGALAATQQQTIDWTGTANDFLTLNRPYPIGATASSALPVTIRVESGPAVIADGKITVSAPGTVWVTGEQAGDQTFASASKARAFNLREVAVSLLGQYSDSTPVHDLAVNGNFLYAACGEQGLRVFDATDPAFPSLVGQYPDPADPRMISAPKVCVAGNMAFVVNYDAFQESPSFDILDVIDPTKPVLRGSLSWRWDAPLAMQVAGQFAYVSLLNGRLLTIDVSNPASPTVSFESSFDGESFQAFQVVGSLIYLANSTGLSVWDISAPTSPVRIAQYFDPLDHGAGAVKVSGGHVYALPLQDRLVMVFDASDLKPLGETVLKQDGTPYRLEAQGDYVFVSRYSLTGCNDCDIGPGGVEVFDVSNPARPVRAGGFMAPSDSNVRVAGDMLYLWGARITALKITLQEPPEPRLEISTPTLGESVVSAPAIPGWEVEYSAGPTPETEWQASDRSWYSLESDGIKRIFVNRRGNYFFRMRKLDF